MLSAFSEVPEPAAERAPNLGQTLRTEHEQRDHEYEQQVGWLKDVANHCVQTVAEPSGRANALVGRIPKLVGSVRGATRGSYGLALGWDGALTV